MDRFVNSFFILLSAPDASPLGVIELEAQGPAILHHEIECPPDEQLRILENERARFERNIVEFGFSWSFPGLYQPPKGYTRYHCIPR